MKKILILILAISLAAAYPSFGEYEEFFVTCDAPVLIGSGIARYFVYNGSGRVSTRYSYGGTTGDIILIKMESNDSSCGSQVAEVIKVPLAPSSLGKIGVLNIGEHRLKLKMNGDGRLIVKEIKG